MELLNIILELKFSEKTPLIEKDNRVEFIESITGQTVAPPPEQKQAMDFNHLPSHTKIILEDQRFAIAVQLNNKEDATNRLMEILQKIYKDFPYEKNKLVRIGVKLQWFHKWNSSFTSLFQKYKEVFYKDIELNKEAVDIGVSMIVQEKDNPVKMNIASGPMKPDQGLSTLIFQDIQFPHAFIYYETDSFINQAPNDLNNTKSIHEYLKYSFQRSELYGDKILNLLGVKI